jgi:hypothetical protein
LNSLTILDETNERSLVNITPPSMSTAIKCIPESVWEIAEEDLREKVERISPKHLKTIDMLRESFWREFDQASRAGRKINATNVYGGICQPAFFVKEIQSNSYKLAYVLTPPPDYEVKMRSLETLGLRKLEEIITAPVIDKEGNLLPKAAHVQFMVIEQILLRVRGAVPYRMETKNLNMNIDQTTSVQNQLPQSMEELDARLAQLEGQRAVIGEGKEVIDVGHEEEEKEED